MTTWWSITAVACLVALVASFTFLAAGLRHSQTSERRLSRLQWLFLAAVAFVVAWFAFLTLWGLGLR